MHVEIDNAAEFEGRVTDEETIRLRSRCGRRGLCGHCLDPDDIGVRVRFFSGQFGLQVRHHRFQCGDTLLDCLLRIGGQCHDRNRRRQQ